MQHFEQLSDTELSQLLEAPVRIMLLIAGADGKIDREERYWSRRLVEARTYTKPAELNPFYETVANGFLESADALVQHYPNDPEMRNAMLSGELEVLNSIFPKLDSILAYKLYKGFLALSEETARASGGFLRFGAISSKERRWLELPMLKPIAKPENLNEDNIWEDWNDWDDDEDDM